MRTRDLGAALLGGNGLNRFPGNFPGTLRPIHGRFIVVLKTIVVVGVAHCPQRLVVETRQSKSKFEFFGKLSARL